MKKNVLLTVWLALPLMVVGAMIWFIFASYQQRVANEMPGVGGGAGDTGGANALGEALAGNDPDAIQAANRAIREGQRIVPTDWAGGVVVTVVVEGVVEPAWVVVVESGADGEVDERREPLVWDGRVFRGEIGPRAERARTAYFFEGSDADGAGVVRRPIRFESVAMPGALEEDEPLSIVIDLTGG